MNGIVCFWAVHRKLATIEASLLPTSAQQKCGRRKFYYSAPFRPLYQKPKAINKLAPTATLCWVTP